MYNMESVLNAGCKQRTTSHNKFNWHLMSYFEDYKINFAFIADVSIEITKYSFYK